MAYIVFVNPGILSAAGVPFAGAATATAFGAALMCIAMGTATNRPLALASGMGLNAVLTFSVIGFQQANVPWQVGMSVIFVEGVLIFLLVLTGLREAVMNAIPLNLKRAIGVGIGIFITLIGLVEGGVIRPAPVTLLTLGDFTRIPIWITLAGLLAILFAMALHWRWNILCGILTAALLSLALGTVRLPERLVAWPDLSTFFAPFQSIDASPAITRIFTPALGMAVFAIMLTDFFDTMGTVVAVGEQAGFMEPDGTVPEIRRILTVDSLAAAVGGLFGASSITTYIESASGVAAGGRSGFTSVVTGLCFLAAAFFAPVIAMVGAGIPIPNAEEYALLTQGGFRVPDGSFFVFPVTAGALIVVGFLMMAALKEIPWTDFEEAFPAFVTILGIPLTYNISYGIGFGFISYTLIKLLHRKEKEVPALLYAISGAFVLMFLLPLFEKGAA
jgi:AGZA family xanthine/uracil permease-like MFS transporter